MAERNGETGDDEVAALRAENERLRVELAGLTGNAPQPRQAGLRSTPAGRDVLFCAVEETRMPMILTDPRQPDDPIIFVNRAFQDLTGYGSDDLVGRNCRFLQGPDTDPEHVARIREALARNEDIAVEILNYRRDGTRFVNDLTISSVFDEAGEVLYHFGSQVDVTRARRDSEALERTELRYRALFDMIDEGFCVIEFLDGPHGPSSDYVHVEANPAYAQNAGIPDVVGQRLREMVGEEADEWVRRYGGVLRTGVPIRFEQELVATGRHLEVSAFRVEPPELRQVAVLFRDVTARKAAEAERRRLHETLERRVAEALAERKVLADIVEGTDAFVHVVDREICWLAINQAAVREFDRIFGVRPKVGDCLPDLLRHHPEQCATARAVWTRALNGEEFVEVAQFGDPARDRRHYEMRFGALRDANGVQVGAYQFVYDVTDRLGEQARLRETEEALRQSQKMEAVGQLTGGVAHDFNNLLTIIRSSVDFLRRPDLPEARKARYLDAVSDTVDRAAKLTGQLLAFARRQALKPEVFDISARVRGIADMLDTVTGSRVRVVSEIPEAPCFVRADASQFETAIINIAVNARDAMENEGTLTLRVGCHRPLPEIRGHAGSAGAFAAVSVSDTGTGIAPETLSHIFEPFFTTKEVGKGTGLGLSQVFGFAKQSGGDVDVASVPGRGATFTLYIPQVLDEAEPVGPGNAGGVPLESEIRLRVLVVEDNIEVGRFATQILQDLGNRTVWAPNAEAALIELERVPLRFDVVFSDVVMPGMGGVALAREVARRLPGLPVVLTSGYSDVLAQEGVQDFELIHKPYSAREIALVLRRVAEQGGGAR